MTTTVDTDGYTPDFGLAPDGTYAFSGNPWLNVMPVHWVAPYPDGYIEADHEVTALSEELDAINASIHKATLRGDGQRVAELHGRREALPLLLDVARLSFLNLRVAHLNASIALIPPHTAHLQRVEKEKERAAARAEHARVQVNAAVMNTHVNRWALEAERDAAMREQAALLYPELVGGDDSVLEMVRERAEAWMAEHPTNTSDKSSPPVLEVPAEAQAQLRRLGDRSTRR